MRSFLPPHAIVMASRKPQSTALLFISEPFTETELFTKMTQAMGLSPQSFQLITVNPSTTSKLLREELSSHHPKTVIAMGERPSRILLETESTLEELRLKPQHWGDVRVIPTYDPACLQQKPEFKKQAWADLQKALG
jgi:Uracil DNA glycosylase superfamily